LSIVTHCHHKCQNLWLTVTNFLENKYSWVYFPKFGIMGIKGVCVRHMMSLMCITKTLHGRITKCSSEGDTGLFKMSYNLLLCYNYFAWYIQRCFISVSYLSCAVLPAIVTIILASIFFSCPVCYTCTALFNSKWLCKHYMFFFMYVVIFI
jgi:hypothetical protein